MNKRTNMSRIGIRIATPTQVGAAAASAEASSPPETSSMSAVRTEHDHDHHHGHPNGLLCRGGRQVHGDTDDTNRLARSRSRSGDASRVSSRPAAVNHWIFLPSIIFTWLIGRTTNPDETTTRRRLVQVKVNRPRWSMSNFNYIIAGWPISKDQVYSVLLLLECSRVWPDKSL